MSVSPDTLDYIDGTVEPLYAAPTLDLIRSQRALVLVPTMGVAYRTGEYIRNPVLLEHPSNFEFLDAASHSFVLSNATKALAGADAARAKRVLPLLPGKFQQLRQLGLPMAIGSDAGSPLQFQAGAIWWELEAWRTLGASHREALIAATEGGALVLRTDDIGRLAVGSRADFVLYRGNVEQGPFDVARVLAVGKRRRPLRGRWKVGASRQPNREMMRAQSVPPAREFHGSSGQNHRCPRTICRPEPFVGPALASVSTSWWTQCDIPRTIRS